MTSVSYWQLPRPYDRLHQAICPDFFAQFRDSSRNSRKNSDTSPGGGYTVTYKKVLWEHSFEFIVINGIDSIAHINIHIWLPFYKVLRNEGSMVKAYPVRYAGQKS